MKNLARAVIIALCALLPTAWQAGHAASDDWSFWIEQDGKVMRAQAKVVLKKAPFHIHFVGPKGNAYGLAATVNGDELPDFSRLSKVFRLSNARVEDSQPEKNTDLAVSALGVVAKGHSSWNLWTDEPEPTLAHSFQSRTANADGTIKYRRRIDRICIDDGDRDACGPVAQAPFKSVHIILTTIPEGSPMRWLHPKSVAIEFE